MSTLYLAYTEKDATTIQQHQVWDRDLFIEAQQKEWGKKGVTVGEATEQEYRGKHWPKRRLA